MFKSINWTPKGVRVKQIISEMQLREQNVLFIDDNKLNLEEVKSECQQILSSEPDCLNDLYDFFFSKEKTDLRHDRLKQYKVLEKKNEFKAKIGSNERFLRESDIRVTIKHDCIKHIKRICDLINRSNQLNFTKIRLTEEKLMDLLYDKTIKSGYIEVKDRFGDYGITGFYSIKENKLLHFVFSCRTLNMGVEQYVYNILNRPKLDIIGEVASDPTSGDFNWINQKHKNKTIRKSYLAGKCKILLKGPCDMSQLFSFIEPTPNIITEFVYVNDRGVSIEQRNHTIHVIESKTLTSTQKNTIINELPFGDTLMYDTSMFNDDIKAVVFSLFTDPNLGIYRRKIDGAFVAFGEYTNDLTNEKIWNDIIEQKVFVANRRFDRSNLKFIKDNYEFVGRLSPQQVLENIKIINEKYLNRKLFVLVLGSETPYFNNSQQAYDDRHLYNRELNNLIRNYAAIEKNIKILDFNKYITSQDDYTNNINHFTKAVYNNIGNDLICILNDGGIKLRKRSIFGTIKLFIEKVKQKLHLS